MCRCLLSKCYNAALPALAEDAFEVNPSVTGLTATDFLLYCYYGARIHIGSCTIVNLMHVQTFGLSVMHDSKIFG